MKLFEIKEFTLSVTDEAWGIIYFKNILKRDRSEERRVGKECLE